MEVAIESAKDTQSTGENGQSKDTAAISQEEMSREAAKAGESRKRMAENLISLAEKDPSARDNLKALVSDQYEKSYFEKKFGDRFSALVSDEAINSEEKEASDLIQKVNDLFADRENSRAQTLGKVKSELGLTSDEAGKFDDWLKHFEGAKIGGSSISMQEAIELASKQMRPGFQASISARGDVGRRPEDKGANVVSISDARIQKYSDVTGAKSAADFESIVEQIAQKGSFSLQV